MSDIAANKALAARFFELLSSGDVAATLALLEDDAIWHVAGKMPGVSGRYGKAEMAALLPGTRTLYKAPLRIWPTDMVAEGDKVAVEAEGFGELMDGRTYDQIYEFRFTIRGGRIAAVK